MSSDAESDTESIKVEPAPKLKGKGKQGKSSGSKEDGVPVKQKKEHKRGVIYLSCIPPKMNVTHVRDFFSQYGEIDRSFLQPEKKSRKGKKNQTFTEGWIEFKRRKHAREVAQLLNNTPLGGKKKKQTYDFLWNIKYLVGLQWIHINERLAYERISRQQKMRAEISAAKRETAFFAKSVGLNKILKRGKKLKTNQPAATETAVDESLEGDNEIPLQQELPASKSKKSKPDPHTSDPETEMPTPRKKKKKEQPSTSNSKKFNPSLNDRNSDSETEMTTPRKKKKKEQPSTSTSVSETETTTPTPCKNKEEQPSTSNSKKFKPNPIDRNSDSETGPTSRKMKKQISKSRMQLFKSFFPSHVNAD